MPILCWRWPWITTPRSHHLTTRPCGNIRLASSHLQSPPSSPPSTLGGGQPAGLRRRCTGLMLPIHPHHLAAFRLLVELSPSAPSIFRMPWTSSLNSAVDDSHFYRPRVTGGIQNCGLLFVERDCLDRLGSSAAGSHTTNTTPSVDR